jgi:hypothetical protein
MEDGRQRAAELRFLQRVLEGEVPMTAGPGDQGAADVGRGHLQASHTDREHVIGKIRRRHDYAS